VKKEKYNHNNHCIDCGILITNGSVRCKMCCKKGKNHPCYKHGLCLEEHFCIDCGNKVSRNSSGRCRKCANLGKLNPAFGKVGNKNPLYGKVGKNRGIKRPEHSLKMKGENHPRWIEGVPSNSITLHKRINRLYGKATYCENPECTGKSQDFDWSNKKHDYKTVDRADWQQLCKSCHKLYDIKMKKSLLRWYFE